MIDFVCKLKDMLPHWPNDSKFSFEEISNVTETSIPHIIQCFSDGLKKNLDGGEMISHDDAKTALTQLCREYRRELEARSKKLAKQQQLAIKCYHAMMSRVRNTLKDHNYPMAFRTLSYFAGEYRDSLSYEYLITLCSDILRIGIKAGENVQVLGNWLEMAIAVSLHQDNKNAVLDALDFIDAYSDFFINESTNKGSLLLGNILAAVEEKSARFGLWEEYQKLIDDLYPNTNQALSANG